MPELLLEILSEEIPARMQAKAADDLLERLLSLANECGAFKEAKVETFVTPRRLIGWVTNLPEKQPDTNSERKGPKTDAPEQAVEGFKRSLPLGAVIEERETPKGSVFFATWDEKGRATADIISEQIPDMIRAFPWPKSMRWKNSLNRWVRPIHNVLCVYDGKPVEGELEFVSADGNSAINFLFSNQTTGHRFLSPDPITVSDFADYRQKLRTAKVMIDRGERRDLILAEASRLAETKGLVLKDDKGLLEEVAGLVEWPVVLIGTIDDAFMDVPPEVLITSMKKHQKYFSCLDQDGKLANRFIVVANTETADGGKQVVAGNERVLRARLSDAKFFWDQDRKMTLASKAPALKDRVFHARMGSLDEKVDRMQALAADLADNVPNADKDKVRSAARLAKADLSTGMVGEFPDLQGIIGRYYALNDGESPEVADAIAEHYSPQGPGDTCPSKSVSVCVALADKIDTLAGFWSIDEKPTGSKDPYALRRAALGVIRLILENNLRLSLLQVFTNALAHYKASDDLSGDLLSFFADRLKVHLKEQGVKHDHIDAVFALGGEDDLVRLLARVDALSEFLGSEDGENLLIAYRRAANIVRIEEKKDGVEYRDIDPVLFDQTNEYENDLWQNLRAVQSSFEVSLKEELFVEAMAGLAQLRAPIDTFFDEVTVNAEDRKVRANRLALLRSIVVVMNRVADFSEIEG